jgi:hypothetical protein
MDISAIALIISATGTIITAVALIVALINIRMTVAANRETTTRIEQVSQTLGGLSVRLEEISIRNEQTGQRLAVLEEKIELSTYREELSGLAWKTKLRSCQRQAARHEPALLEPQPNETIQYILTNEGRAFLPADLKEDIISILMEDTTENNVLLLILGLPYLSRKAQEKQVALDVLLGVIICYADEIRGERQEGKMVRRQIG